VALRSSETIGAIAAALARAQAELVNPEKSLTATILSANPRESGRQFRYAPLAAGLDLVRKALGRQEIAALQATAIDRAAGVIRLDTIVAHASGEWFSSEWPVCALAEAGAPRRMGAALTYARRYALFALVGIAGEDDLDAPDLDLKVEPARPGPNGAAAHPNGRRREGEPILIAAALPALQAAALRNQLIAEIDALNSSDEAANWAAQGLPAKAALPPKAAQAVEARFRDRLRAFDAAPLAAESIPPPGDCVDPNPPPQRPFAANAGQERVPSPNPPRRSATDADPPPPSIPAATSALATAVRSPIVKPIRLRDREHLRFVAAQPCLVCGRAPADPHHLRYLQPRALGRKVSDEFAAPLCRGHHRELHRTGDERGWWRERHIDPEPIALELWRRSHAKPAFEAPPGPANPRPNDPPAPEPSP
jgi:hypothetical protein